MSKILLAKDIKRWKEQDANRHFDFITGLPIKKNCIGPFSQNW